MAIKSYYDKEGNVLGTKYTPATPDTSDESLSSSFTYVPKQAPDTSLRAAIAEGLLTARRGGDIDTLTDYLMSLVDQSLTAERTAIKAAIEAKRDTPASPGSTSNYYWNGALDAVTQVIDGRNT